METIFIFYIGMLLGNCLRGIWYWFSDNATKTILTSMPNKLSFWCCPFTSYYRKSLIFSSFLEIITGCLCVMTLWGYLSLTALYLVCLSLLLSLFDWTSKEYPLVLWLLSFIALLPFYTINATALGLLILAMLACLIPLQIGAGDFLYLATLALAMPFISLIWVVQIGSLTGLICCFFSKAKSIPFIPYLTFGLLTSLAFELLLL